MKIVMPNFIIEKQLKGDYTGSFDASVLFVDMAGFTVAAENLSRLGKDGAEALSQIMNTIYNPCIDAVHNYGGFISAFAGDAFTAIFPESNTNGIVDAALQIASFFKNQELHTNTNKIKIRLRSGIAYGTINYAIIGNKKPFFYYFKGLPISEAVEAEQSADVSTIVMHHNMLNYIDNSLIEKDAQDRFIITKTPKSIDNNNTTNANVLIETNTDIGLQDEENLFIQNGLENYNGAGEYRQIVSCFINFKENENQNIFLKEINDAANRFGAYFNKVDFGDKGPIILVIFGAPIAQEKMLERAFDFLISLKKIKNLKFRASLIQGTAYLGLVGSSKRNEYTALGRVVNLAARSMQLAIWNSIITNEDCVNQNKELYNFKELGEFELKGFEHATKLYKVLSKKSIRNACTDENIYIGRKEEFEQLKKSITCSIKENLKTFIYINGEAGIGKTIFLSNFKTNTKSSKWHWVSLPCDEILKKPLNCFEHYLRKYFSQNLNKSKIENTKRFNLKFEKLLTLTTNIEIKNELLRTKSILAALVGLDDLSSFYSKLDAKARYENTLYAIKNFLLADSKNKPIILFIDDAHWIDEYSTDAISYLIKSITNHSLTIILLSRPNDDGSIFKLETENELKCSETILTLKHFNKETLQELLIKKTCYPSIPSKTIDFFWSKTEGNPFFAEQLLIYLTENNMFDNSFNIISSSDVIPSGIREVIIARIDRLSLNLKEIVKTAAVLGREFTLNVLNKLLNTKNSLQEETVSQSMKDGIQEQVWQNISDIQYIFSHALIRDTVYEMQLKESLASLHNAAGLAIEELFYDSLDEQAEILASHFEQAQNINKAIIYLKKSAENAAQKYQNSKAIEFYNRLCEHLALINNESELARTLFTAANIDLLTGSIKTANDKYCKALEIATKNEDHVLQSEVNVQLGDIAKIQGNNTSATSFYDASLKEANIINNSACLARTKSSQGILFRDQGNYEEALNCFTIQKELDEKNNNHEGICSAVCNIGMIHSEQASYNLAMNAYKKALSIAESIDNKMFICKAIGNMGIVYSNLSKYSEAMNCYTRVYEIFTDLGNKRGIASAVSNMGIVYMEQGNNEKALECYQKRLSIAEELGDKRGYALALGNIAMVYQEQEKLDEALECSLQVVTLAKSLQDKRSEAIALSNIAMIQNELGLFSDAFSNADKCLQISEVLKDKINIGVAYGTKGNASLGLKNYEDASTYLNQAITCHREIQSPYYLCTWLTKLCEMYCTKEKESLIGTYLEELETYAKENNYKESIFHANIFKLKQEYYQNNLSEDTKTIVEKIFKLDSNDLKLKNQAEIFYTLWELTQLKEYKDKALKLYTELKTTSKSYIYTERYKILSETE